MTNTIAINVDPTNPGQYFACCGLAELFDRIDGQAESWFDESFSTFTIATADSASSPAHLLRVLGQCELANTMTRTELDLLSHLKSQGVKNLSESDKVEKKSLESRWRDSPLRLGSPFNMHLNWFHDSRSGGSRFKTWAGQQSVIDIANAMRQPLVDAQYDTVPVAQWLSHAHGSSLTFNFDSDSSVQGAPLDVGFSLDPLGMSSSSKPLMEFLAFVGLQRFRPFSVPHENEYIYGLWSRSLSAAAAAMATAQVTDVLICQRYSFPLLYRTKYLKSFLPAKPVGVLA